MKKEHKEHWSVRLTIRGKQVEKLTPALFAMDTINETFPAMTIYFSLNNFAMFMCYCVHLPEPVTINELDISLVDLKLEPEVIHCRYNNMRHINSLKTQR